MQRRLSIRKAGALQSAIFNSANFSSIATDAKGVIQIFNVGAERMLGYTAAEVMNKITPADISDPQEVIARAKALSLELGTPITPGFEALVFKASRGIEDIYELTYIRKDGSRFPAVVSVTALRDAQDAIIGYLLIGTDNTARKQAEEALLKAGALQSAIFNSANFSSIATDAKGVIQIFNVGAERMLGYTAAEVMNKITPADISDPQEVIARAKALSVELGTPITPGLRGPGLQGLARDRGHLRADLHPQGQEPLPGRGVRHRAARRPGRHHRLPADRHRQHRAQAGGGGPAQGGGPAERDLQQRQLLEHRHRRQGRHPDLQRRRRAHAGLHRRGGDEQDHARRHLRPAGGDRARQGPEPRARRPRSRPGFEALVFKASRGIEDIYELTYIRKDGSRFPAVVSVTALRDAQDAIIGYLLIGTDNTARQQVEEERKKLDQRLRDQQFYTRSLIESNIDALMTTDPRGIITDVNKQTEALTGCTRDELIGAPFKNYFTDPSRAEAGITRVLDRRQGHQLRAHRPRPGRQAHRGVLQRDHLPRPRPAACRACSPPRAT